MAQSEIDSCKTPTIPLHFDAFWEKPPFRWTSGPNNGNWHGWRKKGSTRNIHNGPPPALTYQPEPTYEEPVENHTQAIERDRKVRNQQLEVKMANPMQKTTEISILCGDKPWEHCEQKAASLLYLCNGTEGRRIFKCKHPHTQIEKEPFKEFCQATDDSFTKIWNIT